MSRLKGGERVCGGRGQFGETPLWEFNAIAELWISVSVVPGVDMDGWKLFTMRKLRSATRLGTQGSREFLVNDAERAHVGLRC